MKVLIGSPIRQEPDILDCFLDSLRGLNKSDLQVDYLFVDDNVDSTSSRLLESFRPLDAKVTIIEAEDDSEEYLKSNKTHYWSESLVWKVAYFKNMMIEQCLDNNYDYLFLVDSDLVLHPRTLLRLIVTGKDIISEIFWTKFDATSIPLPQVWQYDSYTLCSIRRGEQRSKEETNRRSLEFINMLKKPGVYRVGGLGACTLFARKPLAAGVNFDEIYNLSFSGEDRHLCIRATAMGFELFVDTYYPGYHIYRESELAGVSEYITSYREMEMKANNYLIYNLLKYTVEQMESFDYRANIAQDKYKDKFTEKGWQEYDYKVREEEANIKKAIFRVELPEIKKLKYYKQFTECEMELDLNVRGSEAGNKVSYQREISIKLIYDFGWKIDSFEINKETNSCPEPREITMEYQGFTRVIKNCQPKITMVMLVHNEADRYLPEVLEHAAQYIDEAVILDDASTDKTLEICKKKLENIPLLIKSNSNQGFNNEIKLRKQLWDLTLASDPDWILCLDADEMFEDRAIGDIRKIVKASEVDVFAFRLYDFWDKKHYREDDNWNAHLRYYPFLVRYQPEFDYIWNEKPLHCGRFPANITNLPTARSELRIKHFGWASPEDREDKYKRYQKLDPEAEYGVSKQYESILDENPDLKRWKE